MTRSLDYLRPLRRTALLAAILLTGYAADLTAQEPGTVVAADPRVLGRSYVFPGTNDTIPYALFVPSSYRPGTPTPLMVGLHGLGRPYDWVMGYEGIVDLAERYGFIMVTPLGYHPRGWYGSRGPGIPPGVTADGAALPANLGERSEQDVMNVLEIVRREFAIDPDRIYLWGHSMGGAGTYHIAAKHPDLWAGLAVGAPAFHAGIETLDRIRHLPILVLQGDADTTIPVEETRKWIRRMEELGMQHVYVEVPGGDHSAFLARDREMVHRIVGFFTTVRRDLRESRD
jgi:predicted peptidase